MVERRVRVFLDGDVSDFNRKMLEAAAGAKAFSRELDSSTDRVANLTQSVLALGPALVPIGAAAGPAVAGLANQLGIAAAGAGVAVLAFHGIGTALKAVNDYAIDPTAAHLKKLNESMDAVGPAGANFVNFLQSARPEVQKLQQLAGAGLFPGLEQGLKSMSGLLPDVERVISTISTTMGELAGEAGANLDSPKWHEFFDFLNRDARPTLIAMGKTAGNFAEGLANLWMAFAPLETGFSNGFLNLSRDFAKWTDGLDQTQGFQDFLAYVEKSGPEVLDTLGSLANALLQIVEAAAPVGSATLPVVKAVADAIATLANSDLGPLIIGVVTLTAALSRMKAIGIAAGTGPIGSLLGKSAYGGAGAALKDLPAATRAYGQYNTAVGRARTSVAGAAAAQERLSTSLRGSAKAAGGAAGLAFIMSGTADKINLSNTATLAMAGSLAGPWGAAVGGAIGLTKDFADSNDGIFQSLNRLQTGLDSNSTSLTDQINALAAARKKVTDFKKEMESDPGFSIGKNVKGTKNAIEGIFGKSDVEEAQSALDKATSTYKKNERAAQDLAFSEAGLSGQMLGASDAARKEAASLLATVDAKNRAADAADNAFTSETNYRQALKDAYAQGKKNNAGIEGNSQAALENRAKISALAESWNKLADSGSVTRSNMKKARDSFIEAAVGMGVPIGVARRLAAELLHIPKNVKPTVHVNDKASGVITDILTKMGKLHDKTIVIRTNRVTHESTIRGDKTGTARADGGYITGPGGPRDDLIPAMLSNGEFVVNAAATRANLALLHAINAQKFADGGPVLQRMAPTGYLAPAALSGLAPAIDERLLATALATATERAVTKSMQGATLHMAADGSIRIKNLGA